MKYYANWEERKAYSEDKLMELFERVEGTDETRATTFKEFLEEQTLLSEAHDIYVGDDDDFLTIKEIENNYHWELEAGLTEPEETFEDYVHNCLDIYGGQLHYVV